MMKKMYVVQSDDGEFWCGMNIWDKQLRKAKIFHSLKYAGECCERFKQRNPKIVEVSLSVAEEKDHEHCEWCEPGNEVCGTCKRFFDLNGQGCSAEAIEEQCVAYIPIGFCPNCGAKVK